jgi:hypothetical protein
MKDTNTYMVITQKNEIFIMSADEVNECCKDAPWRDNIGNNVYVGFEFYNGNPTLAKIFYYNVEKKESLANSCLNSLRTIIAIILIISYCTVFNNLNTKGLIITQVILLTLLTILNCIYPLNDSKKPNANLDKYKKKVEKAKKII